MSSFQATDFREVLCSRLDADPEDSLFAGEVTTAFLLTLVEELNEDGAEDLHNDAWDYWFYSNHKEVRAAQAESVFFQARDALAWYVGYMNVESLIPAELIKTATVKLLLDSRDGKVRKLGEAIDKTLNCGKTAMVFVSQTPSKSLDATFDMGISLEIQEVLEICRFLKHPDPMVVYRSICRKIESLRPD